MMRSLATAHRSAATIPLSAPDDSQALPQSSRVKRELVSFEVDIGVWLKTDVKFSQGFFSKECSTTRQRETICGFP